MCCEAPGLTGWQQCPLGTWQRAESCCGAWAHPAVPGVGEGARSVLSESLPERPGQSACRGLAGVLGPPAPGCRQRGWAGACAPRKAGALGRSDTSWRGVFRQCLPSLGRKEGGGAGVRPVLTVAIGSSHLHACGFRRRHPDAVQAFLPPSFAVPWDHWCPQAGLGVTCGPGSLGGTTRTGAQRVCFPPRCSGYGTFILDCGNTRFSSRLPVPGAELRVPRRCVDLGQGRSSGAFAVTDSLHLVPGLPGASCLQQRPHGASGRVVGPVSVRGRLPHRLCLLSPGHPAALCAGRCFGRTLLPWIWPIAPPGVDPTQKPPCVGWGRGQLTWLSQWASVPTHSGPGPQGASDPWPAQGVPFPRPDCFLLLPL